MLRQGATIVAPGFNGGTFPVPLMMMTLRGVTLTGVYTGTPANLKEFIKFYVEHKVNSSHTLHICTTYTVCWAHFSIDMYMYMYVHLMEMYTFLSCWQNICCWFIFCIRSTSVFTRTHRISNDAEYAPAWRYMYCGSLQLKAPPIVPVKPAEVNATMRKLQEGKVLGRAVIKFWDTQFFSTRIENCHRNLSKLRDSSKHCLTYWYCVSWIHWWVHCDTCMHYSVFVLTISDRNCII